MYRVQEEIIGFSFSFQILNEEINILLKNVLFISFALARLSRVSFGGNASNSGSSKGSFKHRTLNKIDSIGCCMTQVYAPMLCDVNWDYCNQLKLP
jgi:hypothetical protein